MLSSKNLLQRDFEAVVFLSEAPSLLGFCLWWSINFVGSESGQIQSVKLLQNMVSNRTQHPHPLQATHCLYILYFDTGRVRGMSWTRKARGPTFHKAGSTIPIWLIISPVYNSDKHLLLSPFTGQFMTFCFDVLYQIRRPYGLAFVIYFWWLGELLLLYI